MLRIDRCAESSACRGWNVTTLRNAVGCFFVCRRSETPSTSSTCSAKGLGAHVRCRVAMVALSAAGRVAVLEVLVGVVGHVEGVGL